jgi:integrase
VEVSFGGTVTVLMARNQFLPLAHTPKSLLRRHEKCIKGRGN